MERVRTFESYSPLRPPIERQNEILDDKRGQEIQFTDGREKIIASPQLILHAMFMYFLVDGQIVHGERRTENMTV